MTRLNVLLHEMVPDHQIMTPEEVAKLLADYDIPKSTFPKCIMTILPSKPAEQNREWSSALHAKARLRVKQHLTALWSDGRKNNQSGYT